MNKLNTLDGEHGFGWAALIDCLQLADLVEDFDGRHIATRTCHRCGLVFRGPLDLLDHHDECSDDPDLDRLIDIEDAIAANPDGHARHLRWLRNQYALDDQAAKSEALDRYAKFPTELDRWLRRTTDA